MKIGIVATSVWRSPHLEMAKALVRRGHQVAVYTEDARVPTSARFTRLQEDGVEIIAIHNERRNPWLWLPDKLLKPLLGRRFMTTLYAIYRYIRETRCDVYAIEGDWLGVFPALLSYLMPFRWVVTVHDHELLGVKLDYPGEPSSWWREPVKRWVLRRTDGVRANSWVTRDVLVRGGISPETITVVPLHYTDRMCIEGDLDVFRDESRRDILQRHGLPDDCELLVAACRLTPFKGLDLALRAIAIAHRERARIRLIICGGDRIVEGVGSYRAFLERIATESGILASVVFAGNIPPGDVKRYYAAADLHLVPSYIDTFNYSAVEAALTGTRTVMTDLVGCGYWLGKIGAALIVEGRDPERFASAIAQGLRLGPGPAGPLGVATRTREELGLARTAGEFEAMLVHNLRRAQASQVAAGRDGN